MNLLLSVDHMCDNVRSDSGSFEYSATHEAVTKVSDEHGIASLSAEQITGDLLTTDGDRDSIAEVDGLAQLRMRHADKVASDTSDSVLSTSDTLSSHSGCSVGGVGESFIAVFSGVQEVSRDDVWNDVNNSNDDEDSAVQVCSINGSLCGSLASSQDHECVNGANVTLSDAVADAGVHKVENSSSSWYETN